jgi:hypothetical protein
MGRFILAASVGVSRASNRYEHSSKAKLFGNIDDNDLIAVSRNHWLGYKLTDELMVRGGRINLPFGLRIPDHTMWVRSETTTDRESDQQHGLSLVYSSERFRGELLGSAGNYQMPAQFRGYGYSGFLEYSFDPELAVGVSTMLLYSTKDPLTVDEAVTSSQRAVLRHAHGVTARYVPFHELVLLAEADMMKKTGTGVGYVGMATADVEPLRGLHFAVTGEVLNRGTPDPENLGEVVREVEGPGRGETRFGVWGTINWFLLPHLDLRFDMIARQRRPKQLLAQLHFYL